VGSTAVDVKYQREMFRGAHPNIIIQVMVRFYRLECNQEINRLKSHWIQSPRHPGLDQQMGVITGGFKHVLRNHNIVT
jgi:hypothetical protein